MLIPEDIQDCMFKAAQNAASDSGFLLCSIVHDEERVAFRWMKYEGSEIKKYGVIVDYGHIKKAIHPKSAINSIFDECGTIMARS